MKNNAIKNKIIKKNIIKKNVIKKKWVKGLFAILAGMFLLAKNAGLLSEQGTSASAITSSTEMQVHFIDVGQGDSTLIISGEHAMLIDTGVDTKGTAVQNYMRKQGIKKLDYLILTHPDKDHIGGAPVVITKFQIDKVFMSYFKKDTKIYNKVIQSLEEKRLNDEIPVVGEKYELGNAEFTIIAPNRSYEGTEDESNNSSIGILLQNGKNRFIFTGDAEKEAEQDIVKNKLAIAADVYQVGHHGSKTSSTKKFLNAVQPKFAVISCGKGNENGQPHEKVLNNFRKKDIQVFRTDEQGSIVATSDGENITWNCDPSTTWKSGERLNHSE